MSSKGVGRNFLWGVDDGSLGLCASCRASGVEPKVRDSSHIKHSNGRNKKENSSEKNNRKIGKKTLKNVMSLVIRAMKDDI